MQVTILLPKKQEIGLQQREKVLDGLMENRCYDKMTDLTIIWYIQLLNIMGILRGALAETGSGVE